MSRTPPRHILKTNIITAHRVSDRVFDIHDTLTGSSLAINSARESGRKEANTSTLVSEQLHPTLKTHGISLVYKAKLRMVGTEPRPREPKVFDIAPVTQLTSEVPTPSMTQVSEVSPDTDQEIKYRKSINDEDFNVPTQSKLEQAPGQDYTKANNKHQLHGKRLKSVKHQRPQHRKGENLFRIQHNRIIRSERNRLCNRSCKELKEIVDSIMGAEAASCGLDKHSREEDLQNPWNQGIANPSPQSTIDVEIVIREYEEALVSAVLEENRCKDIALHHLTLWTDGSKVVGRKGDWTGAAVVYQKPRDSSIWIEHAWNIQGVPNIDHVELFAIGEALKIALLEVTKSTFKDKTMAGAGDSTIVVIFSDCQAALESIDSFGRSDHHGSKDPVIQGIVDLLCDLKCNGVHVRLQWVPGHSGVRGNERADFLAKRAARCCKFSKAEPNLLVESSCRVRLVHHEERKWLSGRWGDVIKMNRNESTGREYGRQREYQVVDIP